MISDFHTDFRHDTAATTMSRSLISYRPNVSKTLIVSKLIELLLKPPILFLLRRNLSQWIELQGGAQMMYHSFLPTQTPCVTSGTLCRTKTVDFI